ncbi:MAG: hypothetical protein ACTSO2_06355 [Promethearchaeota archaeon]
MVVNQLKIIYEDINFAVFWCSDVMQFVKKLRSIKSKAYATQHDIALDFVNLHLFGNRGVKSHEFRKKGKKYPDLVIPPEYTKRSSNFIVELKIKTSELKYLKRTINQLDEMFRLSDEILYTYFLIVKPKFKDGKYIRKDCLYYYVIIRIKKEKVNKLSKDKIIEQVRVGANVVKEELYNKRIVNKDKEELLGVDNILRTEDLEMEVEVLKDELKKIKKAKDDEVTNLRKSLKVKDDEVTNLRKSLKAKDDEITNLRKSLKAKDDEITNLRKSLKAKDDEITNLRN